MCSIKQHTHTHTHTHTWLDVQSHSRVTKVMLSPQSLCIYMQESNTYCCPRCVLPLCVYVCVCVCVCNNNRQCNTLHDWSWWKLRTWMKMWKCFSLFLFVSVTDVTAHMSHRWRVHSVSKSSVHFVYISFHIPLKKKQKTKTVWTSSFLNCLQMFSSVSVLEHSKIWLFNVQNKSSVRPCSQEVGGIFVLLYLTFSADTLIRHCESVFLLFWFWCVLLRTVDTTYFRCATQRQSAGI